MYSYVVGCNLPNVMILSFGNENRVHVFQCPLKQVHCQTGQQCQIGNYDGCVRALSAKYFGNYLLHQIYMVSSNISISVMNFL